MVGTICNEVFLVGGASAADEFAREVGRADLSQKIRWGEFRHQQKNFGPERAQARAKALVWLARHKKRAG